MDRLKADPKIVELINSARAAPASLNSLITTLNTSYPESVRLLQEHQAEFRALLSSQVPLALSEPVEAGAQRTLDETGHVCPVCLETLGGAAATAAAKEIVSLACGHQIHLSCWLPCVLPIGGGGTAQERHIEDRMGRKCGFCRAEFSQETQRVLKTRRELVRVEERTEQRDDQLASILRAVQQRTGRSHPALDDLKLDAETAALPSLAAVAKQPMPLDESQMIDALTSEHVVSDMPELTKSLRAELQRAGKPPGGEHRSLVLKMRAEGLLTKGFFSRLVKKQILATTPGLGAHIKRLLEEHDELETLHEKRQRRSAVQAAAPALLPALLPAPPAPLPQPPQPPWMQERLAMLANMGFTAEARNRAVLLNVDGDVESAIGILTNM